MGINAALETLFEHTAMPLVSLGFRSENKAMLLIQCACRFQASKSRQPDLLVAPGVAELDRAAKEPSAEAQARLGNDEPAQMRAVLTATGCIHRDRPDDLVGIIRSQEEVSFQVDSAEECGKFCCHFGLESETEAPVARVIASMKPDNTS